MFYTQQKIQIVGLPCTLDRGDLFVVILDFKRARQALIKRGITTTSDMMEISSMKVDEIMKKYKITRNIATEVLSFGRYFAKFITILKLLLDPEIVGIFLQDNELNKMWIHCKRNKVEM